MEEQENKVVVVDAPGQEKNALTSVVEGDNILLLAEEAEKKVNALKKIMNACLSITNPYDWVLIGGKPYLQESGCTKVGNLIGISFEIVPGFPIITVDAKGYKTFTFRVRAYRDRTFVEGEGQRSMNESFFGGDKKQPEEIDEGDVRKAALTNAKANAIKSIIPGLKNVEVSTLEAAGLDVSKISGFAFKEGSKGGKNPNAEEFVCEGCGKKVSGKVASFSKAKFTNHIYCIECQEKAAKTKLKYTGEVVETYPGSGEPEE